MTAAVDLLDANRVAVTIGYARHYIPRDQLATALLIWWDTNPDLPAGKRTYWTAYRLCRDGMEPHMAWTLARAAELCDRHNMEP